MPLNQATDDGAPPAFRKSFSLNDVTQLEAGNRPAKPRRGLDGVVVTSGPSPAPEGEKDWAQNRALRREVRLNSVVRIGTGEQAYHAAKEAQRRGVHFESGGQGPGGRDAEAVSGTAFLPGALSNPADSSRSLPTAWDANSEDTSNKGASPQFLQSGFSYSFADAPTASPTNRLEGNRTRRANTSKSPASAAFRGSGSGAAGAAPGPDASRTHPPSRFSTPMVTGGEKNTRRQARPSQSDPSGPNPTGRHDQDSGAASPVDPTSTPKRKSSGRKSPAAFGALRRAIASLGNLVSFGAACGAAAAGADGPAADTEGSLSMHGAPRGQRKGGLSRYSASSVIIGVSQVDAGFGGASFGRSTDRRSIVQRLLGGRSRNSQATAGDDSDSGAVSVQRSKSSKVHPAPY